MSEITKFNVIIRYKREVTNRLFHDGDSMRFTLNIAELVLLMNSYLGGDEWICIEDLEKSKKTKKKVGFAVERKLIVNIDIYPVLPKSDNEEDND